MGNIGDEIAKMADGKTGPRPKGKTPTTNNVGEEIASIAKGKTRPEPKGKQISKQNSTDKSDKTSISPQQKNNDDKRMPTIEMAKNILKVYKFGIINNVPYALDTKKKIRVALPIDKFDAFIRDGALHDQFPSHVVKSMNSYYISEVHNWIKSNSDLKVLPDLPDSRYIAIVGGIFDLKNRRYVKDDEFADGDLPVLYNYLPVKYIEYTKKEWLNSASYAYLERLADPSCKEECLNHLMYTIGKAATNDRKGKTFTFIYGPKDSGKSVCAELLQEMLGKENCSTIGLSALSQQFAKVNLFHKLVNISSDEDLSAWSMGTATDVKLITSCDTITADVKFQTPIQFKPYSMLISFGNASPTYSRKLDAGGAISSRLNLIPTGPTVKNKDADLFQKKIRPEINLLFSVCLDYYLDHNMPAKIIPLEEIVNPDISPEAMFEKWRQACVTENDSNEIAKTSDDLWPCYQNFVETAPYSSRYSEKAFQMKLASTYTKRKCSEAECSVSAYRGLKLQNCKYSPTFDDPASENFGNW